jgi:hypothetical protein
MEILDCPVRTLNWHTCFVSLAGFSVTAALHLTLTTFCLAAPYRIPCSGAPVPRHECTPVVDRRFEVSLQLDLLGYERGSRGGVDLLPATRHSK